jgi:hypothetical protein
MITKRIALQTCFWLPILLMLPVVSLHATQLRQLSLEEMGQVADKIVQGTVTATRSFWNAEGTKIFTEITVASDETYKGRPEGTVRILQLGGTVDNVQVTVHGALAWTPGEEVLLFLEAYRDGAHVVSGLSQGKYNVVRDLHSGEVFVTHSASSVVETTGPPGTAPRRDDLVPLASVVNRALGTGAGRMRD